MKILYQRCVVLAEYDEGEELWRVKAENRSSGEVEEYGGRFLLVASGEDEPHVPRVEGLESFRGKVIHSTCYKNGKEYKERHVLVVMEISLDLANFCAKPTIFARTPVHLFLDKISVVAKFFNFSFGFVIINNSFIQFYSLINMN